MTTTRTFDPALLLTARGAANLNPADLARRVSLLRASGRPECAAAQITKWETGANEPCATTLGHLADALDTTTDAFYHVRPREA